MSSSRDDNGTFVLSLSSSLQSGNYTCHLPTSAPASLCLAPGSPLTLPAPYHLDERDVRLLLLEARQGELISEILDLTARTSELEMETTNQSRVIQEQTDEINNLQSDNVNLTTQVHRLNQEVDQLQNRKYFCVVILSVCLSVWLSVCLSVCLSLCLCLSLARSLARSLALGVIMLLGEMSGWIFIALSDKIADVRVFINETVTVVDRKHSCGLPKMERDTTTSHRKS